MIRRSDSRSTHLAVASLFLLLSGGGLLCGCGGSSSSGNGNSSNGNMTASNTTTTGGGTDGGIPPTVPPGTPLANVALPAGSWGGGLLVDGPPFPATLSVSRTGSVVTLSCGNTVTTTGPIVLDKDGSFAVQGIGASSLSPSTAVRVFTVTGQVAVSTVNGKSVTTLFLGLNDPTGQGINGTYSLALGAAALPFDGTCP